jgi:hypothetical protein
MATINLVNGPTIAAGQSLSSVIDCSAVQGIQRILMPPAWTSAWLSFQSSPDGVTFQDLYWPNGIMVVVTVVASSTIVTDSSLWHSAYFKFRSGSALGPIPQLQARAFKCVLKAS